MLSEKALKELKATGAKKVLVQIPEGLKPRALMLADRLSEEGIEAVISVEPCFGACDLRDREARALGCGAVLHIGHSPLIPETAVPVIYDEHRQETDPTPILERHLASLPYKSMGLVTTVQHIGSLEKARAFLEEKGKTVRMGKPGRARHPGQVLGCDHSAALSVEGMVDCFLFIGTGMFHPLGIAEKTEKPVLFLDLESGNLKDLSEERLKRRKIRQANIAKASMSSRFGILVSTKPGQMRLEEAEKARKELESKGKKAWVLAADLITPEKLLGLELDCLVNCACPRMTEDTSLFRKPIISPEEIAVL